MFVVGLKELVLFTNNVSVSPKVGKNYSLIFKQLIIMPFHPNHGFKKKAMPDHFQIIFTLIFFYLLITVFVKTF